MKSRLVMIRFTDTVLWQCCIILNVFVMVQGRYVLEVRLFGYSNPSQLCHDCRISFGWFNRRPSCCDSFLLTTCNGGARCDSFFFYCLRTTGSVGRNYSYFGNRTSTANVGDGPINFNQSTVLGLENPLQLQGLTDAYTGVQLYIEIQDQDGNRSHDFIDAVLIDHSLAVGQVSQRQNRTGMFGFVTMDLSITVLCAQNFQGADCSWCVPGFTGTNCDVNIDECVGVTCSGNGQCLDYINSFHCSCNVGFTGELCQIDFDECIGVTCSGNRRCVDGLDSFSCNCDPGFTGELCQTNIDDCIGVNCSGNRYCLDGVNNFSCECMAGYSGPVCDEATEPASTSSILITNIAGAVGGGIAGSLLLTTGTCLLVVAVVCGLTKICRNLTSEQPQQAVQIEDWDGNSKEKSADHVQLELKSSEAYGCTTPQISTKENVVYSQATPQVSTRENVAYGHIMSPMENNVDYDQVESEYYSTVN